MNQTEIRRYLNVIKRAVSFIEGMLENDDGGLLESLSGIAQPQLPQPVAAPVPQPDPTPVPAPQPVVVQPNDAEVAAFRAARQKHIGDLMAIDCWPNSPDRHGPVGISKDKR